MKTRVQRRHYTADDLSGATASLAIEGLIVTDEDVRDVLAVLNGAVSEDAYLQSLINRYAPSRA